MQSQLVMVLLVLVRNSFALYVCFGCHSTESCVFWQTIPIKATDLPVIFFLTRELGFYFKSTQDESYMTPYICVRCIDLSLAIKII